MVSWPHSKLMEGLSATRKVNKNLRKVSQLQGMLTEVDRTPGHTKKLTEVDGRSHGRMEI